MTVALEDRLSELFDHQARALEPPAWHPTQGLNGTGAGVEDGTGVKLVPVGDGRAASPHSTRSRRPTGGRAPLWLASAAAVALVVGGVVAYERSPLVGSGPAAGPEAPGDVDRTIHLATPQVQLDAEAVTVEVAGRTFTPVGTDVQVHSDPGTAAYTTLEVTWFQDDVEMRINLYFAADAGSWWVTEMRTYDGQTPGEWIEQVADRYRTPRGQVYEGEITFGPLRMTGVRLAVSPGA